MNQKPDRVPVAPDISNMVPCRLTGQPFWEVYYFQEPPLWQAYIDAVRYYDFDGWFTYGDMQFQYPHVRHEAVDDISKTLDRWQVRYRGRLGGRSYSYDVVYYVADSPTVTEKPIGDLERDWDIVEKWFAPPVAYDPSLLRLQRKELGDAGAFGFSMPYPGFQSWLGYFRGGLMDLSTWYYERPDLLERLRQLYERMALAQMEMILEERPDFVLLSASGTMTLQSPAIARRISLPTIKKLTRMARDAGVPTMLHSCGTEHELVRWCAEETDLNCINPLEEPPMGDCDLAEVKRQFGRKLSLMGNVHTIEVMLKGSPDDVGRAARRAIDAAGAGGGFILSTGDQCGRDTSDANILKLIEVAKTYGRYD